jgi:DUF1680 family protein
MNSEVSVRTDDGMVTFTQRSSYPWDGDIRIEIQNEKAVQATLCIRIPGWAMNKPVPSDLFNFADDQMEKSSLRINGKQADMVIEKGYVAISRRWKKGDLIHLNLPMEDRIIVAHEKVKAKSGKMAVQYGPVVYCAEAIDNQIDVLEAAINNRSQFTVQFHPGLLGGVNMLEGENLKLVPYYAWANRGPGKMNVWLISDQ